MNGLEWKSDNPPIDWIPVYEKNLSRIDTYFVQHDRIFLGLNNWKMKYLKFICNDI